MRSAASASGWPRAAVRAAAMGAIFWWGLHLGYPFHKLQLVRQTFIGYSVPVYYFVTLAVTMALCLLTFSFKRSWKTWEILWCMLPLVCLPGIMASADKLWSARQWLSWIMRGIIPGGALMLASRHSGAKKLVPSLLYPIVVAGGWVAIDELWHHRNPYWDSFWNAVPATTAANPFYRPDAALALSQFPRGVQGNRAVSMSLLLAFVPIGVWLIRSRPRWKWPAAASLAVFCAAIISANARTAWLGAIACIFLMRAVGLDRGYSQTARALGLLTLCFGLFLANPRTAPRLLERLNSFSFANNSIHERIEVFRTVAALKDHWLAGVGYGQFPAACKAFYPATLVWNNTPDNQFLRWLLENGVAGFLGLMAFCAGLVTAGLRKLSSMSKEEEPDFYRAVLAGWLTLAVTFLFYDGFYWGASNMTFWGLLGVFATCLSTETSSAAS
jgi:hypothetical protein